MARRAGKCVCHLSADNKQPRRRRSSLGLRSGIEFASARRQPPGGCEAAKTYFCLVSSVFFVPPILRSLFVPLPDNALISTLRALLEAAFGRVMISWPFS